MTPPFDATRPSAQRPVRGRAVRILHAMTLLIVGAGVASSPWWGRAGLRALAFFRVQRVEILGLRYLPPAEVMQRLHVDTLKSVWDDIGVLEARVRAHPQIEVASVTRKLPGTLVVHVRERIPVALVASAGGVRAVDRRGVTLPIDPVQSGVDAPIVAAGDTAAFRLLDGVRDSVPSLFSRISEVRRGVTGDMVLMIGGASILPVHAPRNLSARRLAEIIPVEGDLARRQARVAELDLRFRDQVIARLQ